MVGVRMLMIIPAHRPSPREESGSRTWAAMSFMHGRDIGRRVEDLLALTIGT
jgi:hypothetical protein